jgi:Fe-S cluster biogenesis protein NfuA
MEQAALASAVESVRHLVQADGGDMELMGVDEGDGEVRLRLILDGVDCHECVMPRPILEDIAGNLLRRSVPDVKRVAIDDPREQPGYVAPEH